MWIATPLTPFPGAACFPNTKCLCMQRAVVPSAVSAAGGRGPVHLREEGLARAGQKRNTIFNLCPRIDSRKRGSGHVTC